MPKFTLIAEHTDFDGNPDGTKQSYEFYCDYLPEILDHIELFLRGTGYVFNGKLDFLEDEPVETFEQRMWNQSMENVEHHESYFDTERNK